MNPTTSWKYLTRLKSDWKQFRKLNIISLDFTDLIGPTGESEYWGRGHRGEGDHWRQWWGEWKGAERDADKIHLSDKMRAKMGQGGAWE